ncbi:MAG: 16S rRNA (guanine(966)-N(2))-methyltransferase RsmD [Dinoroseobacter sp.]|nr:16S rRNA (guanine(966)-N(2))-methyltransferase RsmD [Dinoroseobacter sp.]
MRIIAGRFGGRRLAQVGKGDAAAHLRPTPDRVREALFSSLSSGVYGDPISNARVLDLFAGTGALGLEALSRGASSVTFVENGRAAQNLLQQNIDALGVSAETTLQRRDALKRGENAGAPFDLIFLDPPYGKNLGARALELPGWIAPGALVVWEDSTPQHPPEGFVLRDQRRYGDTCITVMEALG